MHVGVSSKQVEIVQVVEIGLIKCGIVVVVVDRVVKKSIGREQRRRSSGVCSVGWDVDGGYFNFAGVAILIIVPLDRVVGIVIEFWLGVCLAQCVGDELGLLAI